MRPDACLNLVTDQELEPAQLSTVIASETTKSARSQRLIPRAIQGRILEVLLQEVDRGVRTTMLDDAFAPPQVRRRRKRSLRTLQMPSTSVSTLHLRPDVLCI